MGTEDHKRTDHKLTVLWRDPHLKSAAKFMSREDVSKTWLLRNSPSLGTPFQTLQNSARNRHCEGGARNDFGFNVLEHLNEIFEITGTWKEGLVYYKVDICRISRVCTMASFFTYAVGKKVRVVVFQFEEGFSFLKWGYKMHIAQAYRRGCTQINTTTLAMFSNLTI